MGLSRRKSSNEEGTSAGAEAEAAEAGGSGRLFRRVGQATLFSIRAAASNVESMRDVPLKRRVQTLSVLTWLSGVALFPLLTILICIYLIFATRLSLLVIAYITWFVFMDRSPKNGTRRRLFSRLGVWNHIRDYFPIRLVKTCDIEPNRSYVFGYHPHGVISMGALVNFASYATRFDEKFPGLNVHVLTLASNFMMPFLREWILWMGLCDASRQTCGNILRKGGGECILLAVGGAEESLDAHPGTYRLTLKNRKGFVRVALKAGASLVPVMSFGENELWTALPNPDGSKVRNFQESMKRLLKFTFPIIHGRGIFSYNFGLMPFRRPIHSVVGEPILIDSPCDVTTDEGRRRVDEVHALYISKLKELFETHKKKYNIESTIEIK
ncbi:diacylglycerol O-acyltransferase 2 [Chloropicon roscoffensis]|uniref:Acyltransferase n=1 Tax=Chloropicon roscoffensis TaxID=1461544 RepID=A0AAX4P0W6_9CHLO|mmetsp:Transcript_3288/g.9951  ORF Transcript_3288/g.9951 Transcript_3288/m.9951 type:complete len:383 (-) Transcript_3288:138-1286(-)